MGRLIRHLICIGLLSGSALLIGCGEDKSTASLPPTLEDKIVLETDDGESHKLVYENSTDGLCYVYDVKNATESPIYNKRKDLENAYNIEANMDVSITGDDSLDLDPFELGTDVIMTAPNTYKCNASQQSDYFGRLSKAGYSIKQRYLCEDYNDYIFRKGHSSLRVIFQKDEKLKIFYDTSKISCTSDTYINEKVK